MKNVFRTHDPKQQPYEYETFKIEAIWEGE